MVTMGTRGTARANGRMPERDEDWGLPGNRASRRAALWATAAKVAGRYGIGRIPLPRQPFLTRDPDWAHEQGARDLHRVAVHLRGGFLKLGQFASARPDLLPEPYVRELSKLQDRVPPAPALRRRAHHRARRRADRRALRVVRPRLRIGRVARPGPPRRCGTMVASSRSRCSTPASPRSCRARCATHAGSSRRSRAS